MLITTAAYACCYYAKILRFINNWHYYLFPRLTTYVRITYPKQLIWLRWYYTCHAHFTPLDRATLFWSRQPLLSLIGDISLHYYYRWHYIQRLPYFYTTLLRATHAKVLISLRQSTIIALLRCAFLPLIDAQLSFTHICRQLYIITASKCYLTSNAKWPHAISSMPPVSSVKFPRQVLYVY